MKGRALVADSSQSETQGEPRNPATSVQGLQQLSLEEIQALRRRTGRPASGQRPPAIERQRRFRELPLSFAQERLWFLDQLGLVGGAYNTAIAFRLQGNLDVQALERSLAEVIRRHESLRTRFEAIEGAPVQVIDLPASVTLSIRTVSNVPEDDRAQWIGKLSEQDRQRAFDLESGPVVRASLLEFASDDHALLLSIHHIACDGWSFGILTRELTSLYEAYSQQVPSTLSELDVQYADYALWQRGWLRGQVFEEQLRYWCEHLMGAPPQLELPTDHPRPAVESYRGAVVRTLLSPELSQGLKEIARRHKSTLFIVALATYQVLLWRWSGQRDIVVGTPIAGRNRREIEDMVGFFVNTVVLRAQISPDLAFNEHLATVRELSLKAHAHQDFPFEALVKELCPDRNLARQPVFQVMLTLQPDREEPSVWGGLRWTGIEGDNSATHFDLNLGLSDTPQGIGVELQYATDLFDDRTVRRMVGNYRKLLEGIVAYPECRIRSLPWLDDAERALLLEGWNDTRAVFPGDRTIHELFEEQARRTPRALAVTCGEESLSYEELNDRAEKFARYLRAHGVGPDQLVALCMERGTHILVAMLGTLKAGGAYVPLDPTNPPARLKHILSDAKPKVIVIHGYLADRISSFVDEVVDLEAQWSQIEESYDERFAGSQLAEPHNLAYVIYTSGSTGLPKGVMVTHRNIVNYSVHIARQFDVRGGHGSLIATSFSFDLMLTGLYPPLLCGRTVRLLPPRGSYELVEEILKSDHLAPLKLTPSHLPMLESALKGRQLEGRIDALVLGGEPLLAAAARMCRKYLPVTRLFNHYGPTETTVGCIINDVDEMSGAGDVDDLGDVGTARVPIGRPISNTNVFILDEWMQPVPVGVIGDIHIGGAGVARGYLGNPALTAERFRPDPFNPDSRSRLYLTGDRGRWLPEGKIDCLGRADLQVKIRGYRIELDEVESQILQHPGVMKAAVIAREEVGRGTYLIAYLVPEKTSSGGTDPTSAESDQSLFLCRLREHLKERLPDYMIPSVWMVLDQLPTTANGKLDRAALPAALPRTNGVSLKPRTELERALADIWSEILQRGEVSVRDNFFDLGGHSLLATRVASRIRDVLHIDLPLRTLFEMPTVEELAAGVAEELQKRTELHSDETTGLERDLWKEIDKMSDEEVAARLEELRRN